ncbi:hypothetical protein CBR_g39346 [Chara braunii]|uniref:Uncharacterized protein n=1 Tax=Chara braunii TaxID=69332 RepID=A0A388LRD8_CHABU|nr:hypothetical protein CBR_g39346 [Chara braunii]|eukprot:GBG84884.1 hypothetical protein CBR_g39346 [Chara braunii]
MKGTRYVCPHFVLRTRVHSVGSCETSTPVERGANRDGDVGKSTTEEGTGVHCTVARRRRGDARHRGGTESTLAGKVSVVAVEGGSVRAPRGGMTVLAASQTPTPAQNGRALLNGKDTAMRDKALREVLLRDLGRRRASVTEAAACPGEGGEDELEALGHREGSVLQVVVDGLAEVEVVAMVTLWRQRGNNVLLTILERVEAAREVVALWRGTTGATVKRGTALGSAVRGGGGIGSALRLGRGGGVKTGLHPLMVPGGLVSLRGRCEVVHP